MWHTRTKAFAGALSFIAWAALLFLARRLESGPAPGSCDILRTLLFYVSIPAFFTWLFLGFFFGFPLTVATFLYLSVSYGPDIWIFPALSLLACGFAGYALNKKFEKNMAGLTANLEKLDEKINILSENLRKEGKDNSGMRNNMKRITYLKGVLELYGTKYTEHDILDAIAENTLELFADASRVLLYVVDTGLRELRLARQKRKGCPHIHGQNGDSFDRWVLKHALPLHVEDAAKDFRFSAETKSAAAFGSLISAPLTVENRVLGILRVESLNPGKFTQSDLRFLHIIADFSGVSLHNAALYKKAENLAIHDSLTGLYVHKYFVQELGSGISRAGKNKKHLSVLMLDIDNFKIYNDTYGHTAGDLVLRRVSDIMSSFAQEGGIVSRYGGEEFAMMLPGRSAACAFSVAEKLRRAISEKNVVIRRRKTEITVSVGVASFPADGRDPESLIKAADERLYTAKRKGKNRVCAS